MEYFKLGLLLVLGVCFGLFTSGVAQVLFIVSLMIVLFAHNPHYLTDFEVYLFVGIVMAVGMFIGDVISLKWPSIFKILLG